MTTIEQKYWTVIDFHLFREKFPELKFKETESITAIILSKTTPSITLALKENKVFQEKKFSVRFDEYKLHLSELFKAIDKKDVEVMQVAPTKKKV